MPLETEPPILDPASERRLVWLLFARLVLCGVSLLLALGIDGLGRELSEEARRGLYFSVAFAFLATAVSGVFLGSIRNAKPFAALQIGTDVAIVSLLVHFSGGLGSVFSFLYVVVTAYGAALFGRAAGFGAAALATAAYGTVLLIEAPGSGESFPVAVLATRWGVHAGALFLVAGLSGMFSRDLERAGAALHQSKSDLHRLRDLHQHIVESLMSGLLTTDSQGRITSFNAEAERITGVSARAAMGELAEDIIPGSLTAAIGHLGHGASTSPRTRTRYCNTRGEELFLGVAGALLRGPSGDSHGYVIIFQDVTKVVRMEGELRRSERLAAVGEMAAKIAHEIRNPLASMSGAIQLLQIEDPSTADSEGSDPEKARLMDIAVRETDRLNRLITDFLQFARPRPPAMKAVAIDGVAREILEIAEASRPAGVELSLIVHEAAVACGDPDQLHQLLWNLVLNGLQALSAGGKLVVEVGTQSQDDPGEDRKAGQGGLLVNGSRPACAVISVTDNGPGISSEDQERIFEPFFTTKNEGSGLGLATVHRIVESHGGTLQVDSRLGAGTRFRIALPLEEQGRQQGEAR